jgi:low affinity Fe/Cu permease
VDNKFEAFSKKLTRWIGSPQSIIIHTVFFIAMFCLRFLGVSASDVLLILTTLVSLEAIYLAIFIQMTVNQQGKELEEVSEDIEEIQGDVDEIQKDVDEIQEDVEDIQEEIKDQE